MEDSSANDPPKKLVDSVSDKTLIVSIDEPVDKSALDKMDKRVRALETALQQLGGHFVKYQQDVAGILVQECSRLTEHMSETKKKIEKKIARADQPCFVTCTGRHDD
mmetsp:Transcript_107832/g.196296  ORF Transcript_107832/g.196296 Transcript_107832/m.196296 type:complete len:107 (+) Transcript_107832:45-365(+)